MHMDGLETMVKNRGGLQGLGSYGIPRRQAAWQLTFKPLARQYFLIWQYKGATLVLPFSKKPNLVSSSTFRIMMKTLQIGVHTALWLYNTRPSY